MPEAEEVAHLVRRRLRLEALRRVVTDHGITPGDGVDPAQLLLSGVGEIEIMNEEDATSHPRDSQACNGQPLVARVALSALDLVAEVPGDGDEVDRTVPDEADVRLPSVEVVHLVAIC